MVSWCGQPECSVILMQDILDNAGKNGSVGELRITLPGRQSEARLWTCSLGGLLLGECFSWVVEVLH